MPSPRDRNAPRDTRRALDYLSHLTGQNPLGLEGDIQPQVVAAGDSDGQVLTTVQRTVIVVVTTAGAGEWTPQADAISPATVELWGGGGSGAAGDGSTSGGAGGGGEYSTSFFAFTPLTTYSYSNGAGGNLSAGEQTTFDGTTIIAKGGSAASGGTGGAGGTGGTGTTKYDGGAGGDGSVGFNGGGGGGSSAGSAAIGVDGNDGSGPNGAIGGVAPAEGGNGGAGGSALDLDAGGSVAEHGIQPGGGGGGGGPNQTFFGRGAAGKIRITYAVGALVSGWEDPAAPANNSITNAMLRDSAGLSVIGRSANSTGNPADIVAATDGHVLRLSGTTLGFGTVVEDGIETAAVTGSKLASGLFTKLISGFELTYSSASVILVAPGYLRDKSDFSIISIASQKTITITSNGINGNDSFQPAGTAATNIGTATVTGTTTTFFTSFGTRALTGTVSSAVAVITGVGTKFLTEIAIGDLIGNTTRGYFQVQAIASDTSLTISSTPGGAFSAEAANAIENPTIKVSTNTAIQVKEIASNTSLTLVANSSATVSGVTYRIGVPATTTTYPAANNMHMSVWLGAGETGTDVYVSTQRTTPFGITGYLTLYRRIGSILLNSINIVAFDQTGTANERTYQYEIQSATANTRVVNGGSATGWTEFPCAGVVPPSGVRCIFSFAMLTTVGRIGYVRKRNAGEASTTRNTKVVCNDATNGTSTVVNSACDGAQYLDYNVSNADADLYADLIGFVEYL